MTSLATISSIAPKNLIVAVLDNGVYEFTKGLPVPTLGVDWSAVPEVFTGFKKSAQVTALEEIKKPMSGPYFIHARIKPGPLPPGPGLPAVIAHDRFKKYLSSAAQSAAKQSC